MKSLTGIFLVGLCMMLSGCTVLHLFFVRNLAEGTTEVTFVFDQSAAVILPDSMYIPYSSSSHLINKNTASVMKDSILIRKFTLTKMRGFLPTGSMIMLDKFTSKKIGYHDPLKMEVVISGKPMQEVYFGTPAVNAKTFSVKGKAPVLHWYDIY